MSGVDVSHQSTSAYGAYASARAIGASMPGAMRKKPSGVRSPVVNSRSRSSTSLEQRRRKCVRPRDENRRDVEDVRREPRRDERADELARRDEHLAAQWPHFFSDES